MKRPEEYPQQSRFYTGLYSTKAFNIMKTAIQKHSTIWGLSAVRAADNEIVAVCSDTTIWSGGRKDVTPDVIRDFLCEYLGQEECSKYNDADKDEYAYYAVIRGFFLGKKFEGSFAKLLDTLKGKRRDDVAAELASCQYEEERKVRDEYGKFMELFERRYKFPTANQIIGSYGTTPVYVREEVFGALTAPADKTVVGEFIAAEAEMRKANNRLAIAFEAYKAAMTRYAEARCAFKSNCTETKNRRLKEIADEFKKAKRTA